MGTPRKESSGARLEPLVKGYGRTSIEQGTAVVVRSPNAEQDIYYGEEWQLVCRVAASRGLSKSELLPKFLLHVCELTLSGRADQITEQRLGTTIFKRSPDYNPGEDNIVRSYARTMRKRLDDYFDDEGKDERLRIHIPRGGYVPVFELAADQTTESHAADADATSDISTEESDRGDRERGDSASILLEPDATVTTLGRSSAWLPALAGLLVGLLLATAGWFKWNALKTAHEQSAAHAIWSQLFQANRNTLIVPADSGLGILENLSQRSVTVEQYANRSYMDAIGNPAGVNAANIADLGQQRYTSFVDLDIATSLQHLPEFTPNRTQFRFSRGVTAEDMKDSNVILLGSKHTNPWVELFEKEMSFTLEYASKVDESHIVNHAPEGAEPQVYRNGTGHSSSLTYGVVAYLASLDGTGHVLIVEGLNMAATQAAAEVLFNEKLIAPVLERARSADGHTLPFELIVETKSVGAASPTAQIAAVHIHKH